MSSAGLKTVAIEEPPGVLPGRAGWRPLLHAAGFTGSAALGGAALSVVATKIFATMLGPAEVAVLATLQQIRQAGVIGATLGGQTALIQGASARSGDDRRQYLRTVFLLMGTSAALMALGMLAAPGWVASWTGLGIERARMVRWMTVPVMFSVALVFLNSLLNARGEIGRLAVVQMASPAALAILAYPVARAARNGDEDALVWWISAAAVCAAALSLRLLGRRKITAWFPGPAAGWNANWSNANWWNAKAARGFLTVSGSILAGSVASSLVLMAARARILHQQGFAVAGQFDAAWAVSMNHVSLVLASLQTYCLPLLARTSDRAERSVHLNRMLTAAALAAATVVCVLAWLKPVVLVALYSPAFGEAARYLRWTLIGDYLKVSSWVLSIPVLAAADMRVFLTADLSAYAVFAAGAAAAGHFRGAAEGAAIAFALMYAVHLAVCGWIAWTRYGFRPGAGTALIWTGGLALVLGVSAMTWRIP